MMLTISPLLTLVVILTLPLSVVVTIVVAKRSQKHFVAQQKHLGELNGHVEEMYTGHKVVKAFGRERQSMEQFDEVNDKLYDAGWRAQFISGTIMPLMGFVGNIGYVIVSVVGGVLVTRRAIEIGDIQAFIQYSRQFTRRLPSLRISRTSFNPPSHRQSAYLKCWMRKKKCQSIQLRRAQAAWRCVFENVSFGYKADQLLIEDMNVDVKQGQTVAIVGPTGAGKTTLINLLMRFYELNKGKITIDGTDITALRRGELRDLFGMVADTWLFNGTIRDNIGYGREGATEQEIIRAAEAAHADHFIRTRRTATIPF